jgi:hypothetical protein
MRPHQFRNIRAVAGQAWSVTSNVNANPMGHRHGFAEMLSAVCRSPGANKT